MLDLKFLLRLICCGNVLFGISCTRTGEDIDPRPNIIFILTDDQRFDAIGYAGNELANTPEMDRLAQEGVYFKNALVSTPICSASRASILTGLYERSHRYSFSSKAIRSEYMAKSYPRLLKEAGYATAFYGKYGVKYDSLNKQFDMHESYDRNGRFADRRGYFYKTIGNDTVHLTRYTGQKAVDFIVDSNPKKPFCLSLSFSAPHAHDSAKEQYYWQKVSDTLLKDVPIPAPQLAGDTYFESQPEFVRQGFNRLRWGWRYDTPQKYQHSIKGYYRMISGIDREIGRIREALKKKKLDKNTVIILMGDNGYFLGERQLAGKWLLYDNSIRVPLIIYDPRTNEHKDITEMALNVDIPPTILDLAEVKNPNSWQGKSLMPLVSGKEVLLNRDTVLIEHLWEFDEIPPSEGLRTQEWKYFRYVNDKSHEELYNLKIDPQEVNNLVKDIDYKDTLNELREKCDDLIAYHRDSFSHGPTNLNVEFGKPLGVDNALLPSYSWELPSQMVRQVAYQILVASSLKNLDRNIGDVWNSGRVGDSFNDNIPHMGHKLEEGKTYFWKIRVYDEDNQLTSYSEKHSYTYVR